jgi:hypothetical protein
MTFDVRNLPTPPEGLGGLHGPNYVGNIFFGDQGFIIVDHSGFELYKSKAGNISGEAARGSSAGNQEKYEKTMSEKALNEDTTPHMLNFFEGIRKRDYKLLHADIEIGARSAAFCHLANISYRVGRLLRLSPSTGRVLSDEEANAYFTRNYRRPYVVPVNV